MPPEDVVPQVPQDGQQHRSERPAEVGSQQESDGAAAARRGDKRPTPVYGESKKHLK